MQPRNVTKLSADQLRKEISDLDDTIERLNNSWSDDGRRQLSAARTLKGMLQCVLDGRTGPQEMPSTLPSNVVSLADFRARRQQS